MKHTLTLLSVLLLAASGVLAGETFPLDGTWQIVFDRNNEGGAKQWIRETNFPHEQKREIAVPSCWELIEKDYEGVAYYRHTFKVPANWAGKTVRLHFDAVNFRSEVWLNDTVVGKHDGGFTPFAFRVDDRLKFDGENTLILRAVGPILMQNKRVDGMGLRFFLGAVRHDHDCLAGVPPDADQRGLMLGFGAAARQVGRWLAIELKRTPGQHHFACRITGAKNVG